MKRKPTNLKSAAYNLRLVLVVISATLTLLPVYWSVEAQKQDTRLLLRKEVKELPAKAKRFALVVGVDEYQDTQISRLSGATNDAKALARALTRYAGFPQDQVILLASDQPLERQPTRGNILQYLSNLRGVVPADGLLLVSFAGHGIERGGRGFLCPSDARIGGSMALLEATAVSVDTVREWIRETGVKQVLIILDACRNDPSGRGELGNRLTDSFAQKFNFDVRNQEVEAFATLYATSVGHLAYEYKEKQQGYFTWMLVEGLKGGAANDKGEVTLGGLVSYLQEQVPKRIRLDLGQEKLQKPYAIVGGYKADELVISITIRVPIAENKATPPNPNAANPTEQENVEVQTYSETVNRVGIEMVRVPAGKFIMGSPSDEKDRESDEGPRHEVTVSSFYMGKYEVTQAQWREAAMLPKVRINLMPDPSKFKGDNLPVEHVSWEEAAEFCERLSKATGKSYRLPTEAQWEYACRAGTTGMYAGSLEAMAWYGEDLTKGSTHPVGTKQANRFGLYDMHGNVWEWCADWYGENYYFQSPSTNPTGPSSGSIRVGRGGGWDNPALRMRSASRGRFTPDSRYLALGFRLVRTYN
jgi:formylglycine-generating enzyme required for sulfatase activity